ncbi:MAG: diguanylate cyclase [Firmicutes bacterium]|nr:diguanylate cyclase [Bacillota bacterium]
MCNTEIKEKILIVDDSRLNIELIKNILIYDYDVITTTSGKEAMVILGKENVDLILLDIIMPEIDGFQLCKMIKQDSQICNIPIIFISARFDEEHETRGLELGAIDYIHKPISPSIVKARVKNHLELKRYRDILEKQSRIDGLTGIANRRYLDEVLNIEWKRALRNGDTLALILLDIDYFKKYNDYYGHLVGDDCLREVGKILLESVKRETDFVARYGGEEFVVLLPSAKLGGALKVGERIRKSIEEAKIEHKKSDTSDYVTVSIGIALQKPSRDQVCSYLVEMADKALYKAKNEGRNRIMLSS